MPNCFTVQETLDKYLFPTLKVDPSDPEEIKRRANELLRDADRFNYQLAIN